MNRLEAIGVSGKQAPKRLHVPACHRCKDYGFTGATPAILENGDHLIEAALKDGVACSCVRGRWFAEMQVKNLEASGRIVAPVDQKRHAAGDLD